MSGPGARRPARPVEISAVKSSDAWVVTFILADMRIKEIFVRIGEHGRFKSTGHLYVTNPLTGLPMPGTSVTAPLSQRACRIYVKYTDPTAGEHGPYGVPFDPKNETVRSAKQILGMTSNGWVALREFDGKLLLYFTHLLCYRDAISEIRYSLGDPTLEKRFPIPPPALGNAIPASAQLYVEIPMATPTVHVQLEFQDGTQSEVVAFTERQRY